MDKNLLKFQNTALSTKLDFLKKEIKTLKTINESLEMKVKNNETFLSVFSLAWNHVKSFFFSKKSKKFLVVCIRT